MTFRTAALLCFAIACFYLFRRTRYGNDVPLWIRIAGRYGRSVAFAIVGFCLLAGSRIAAIAALPVYALYMFAYTKRIRR